MVMIKQMSYQKRLLEISNRYNYKTLRKTSGIEGNVGKDSYTNDLVFTIKN